MNKEELIQKLVQTQLDCMDWSDLATYFWRNETQFCKNLSLEDLIKVAKDWEIEDFEIEF